jgi:hypothetical protein
MPASPTELSTKSRTELFTGIQTECQIKFRTGLCVSFILVVPQQKCEQKPKQKPEQNAEQKVEQKPEQNPKQNAKQNQKQNSK